MSDVQVSEQFVDLVRVPMPALFFALLSRRFTGTVVIEAAGPERAAATIWLRGGMPVRTDLPLEGSRLGELAQSQGIVAAAAVADALAVQDGRRLGEILVERGVPEAKIGAALRLQCMRRLMGAFASTEGVAVVRSGSDAEPGLLQLNVLELIQRGITAHYDPERVRRELGAAWAQRLRATAALPKYVDQFKLRAEDGGVIAYLASGGEAGVDELARLPETNAQRVSQLVALLFHCRMIEPAIAALPSLADDPAGFERDLTALEGKIAANGDPALILALSTDADATEIDAAWSLLAARFDPGALPADATEALRERLTTITDALGRVRAAARHRRQALAEIAGLRLVVEGKHARGLAMLDEAVSLGASGPEIDCARAWSRFQLGSRDDAALRTTDAELERILAKDPDVAAGHYYRGFVLAGLGVAPKAVAAFKRAAELDPRLVDAQRQLRALQRGERLAAPSAAPAPQRRGPAEFAPLRVDEAPKHELLTRSWKRLYWFAGLALLLLIAVNIILRLDVDF